MAAKNSKGNKNNRKARGKEEEDEWEEINVPTSLASPGGGQLESELKSPSPKIPTRPELLAIVRSHSQGTGRAYANSAGQRDRVTERQIWQELLDVFFVRGLVESKADKSEQDDDLVFFVRLEGIQNGDGKFHETDDFDMQPFFVSRWAPELRTVIGSNAWEVDWRRSFYLNLIAHSSFSLTIAICSRNALRDHQQSSGIVLKPIYKVTKRVYASPSRTNFQRDSKATETVASYPDICFVIDDFDDTFNKVVLTDADHCYCVLLNACGGAAFPDEGREVARTSREARMLGDAPEGSSSPMVTLFSGFVNYDMVHSAFNGGRRLTLEDIFQKGPQLKSEKLIMRGPGGRGEVEVAVSVVPEDIQGVKQVENAPYSVSKPPGLGAIMQRAAEVASTVAKNVAAATSEVRLKDEVPLRCCLMTLSLPWDVVARDLLFKELPEPTQ